MRQLKTYMLCEYRWTAIEAPNGTLVVALVGLFAREYGLVQRSSRFRQGETQVRTHIAYQWEDSQHVNYKLMEESFTSGSIIIIVLFVKDQAYFSK